MKKCDGCEFLDIVEKIHENPIWDRIFYECRHVDEGEGTGVIAIRKLGRTEGPDEPWDPIPEIKTLLAHECISEERRAAGQKWLRDPRNKGLLQKALRKLRIELNADGIPVKKPEWCPLRKDENDD